MSHGLTLTEANTVIWFGPVNNYETYEQANARIIRPGQTSKTIIAHLTGTPIEHISYKRLLERGTFQGMLLELFRRQELEF
jgi:SNF2 family DNA or RNA helicase